MQPLAEAIDVLQGEKYCYYGYLLPTLVCLRKKIETLAVKDTINVCKPLLNAIKNSLQSRFKNFFEIEGAGKLAAMAAVTHPKFKVRWLTCLDDETQEKVRTLFLQVASEELGSNRNSESEAGHTSEDDFFDFGETLLTAPAQLDRGLHRGDAEIEVSRYISRPDRSLEMLKDFPLIRKLFLHFNTPLPSSAAVERLFSYATLMDIPKFNRLTDAHFEDRVLFKANAAKAYL